MIFPPELRRAFPASAEASFLSTKFSRLQTRSHQKIKIIPERVEYFSHTAKFFLLDVFRISRMPPGKIEKINAIYDFSFWGR